MDIDFDTAFTDAFTDLAGFVPKLIAFLVVLVVGLFVAKWIRRIITSLLRKIQFDSYLDKAGIGAPLERAGFADSGKLVAQLLYYLIAIVVLQLALSAFGDNPVSDALNDLIGFIPRLVVAIAIIIITGLVANTVKDLIGPALANVDFGPLAGRIAVGAIWMIGVFAAIDQIQFAEDIVDTLFTAIVGSLSFILIIKFGVGGIWAARDHFWPAVYSRVSGSDEPSSN